MKFATKRIEHYPPHLRHVTALPWEISSYREFHGGNFFLDTVYIRRDIKELNTSSNESTYISSNGGMMTSGRSIARHCIAAAESLLPVLLNIASDATVVIPFTN